MFSSTLALATSALAPLAGFQEHTKSEFDLALPDLSKATFLGIDGHSLVRA